MCPENFRPFVRKGGSLSCEVTGSKQYSCDLPQGGMEIPCVYAFRGKEAEITKVRKFFFHIIS